MTSLASSTVSPIKDGASSLPRRQSSFARSPLRALYDLLIAPMEGVSVPGAAKLLGLRTQLTTQCPPVPLRYRTGPTQPEIFQNMSLFCPASWSAFGS